MSCDDSDAVSETALTDAGADGLVAAAAEAIGVNVADVWLDAVPTRSARKRRRSACGVLPAAPGVQAAAADSWGEGLTLGVVERELVRRSHWSTSWTSSTGVKPPPSSTTPQHTVTT